MTVVLMTVFFIGIIIGIPIALVMGIATLAAIFADGMLPLEVLPQTLFSGIDSFPMMTIPFFMLASDLMTGGRLTDMLIKFSKDLFGHIRGGLGHANVLVSVMFAGISGSALADAAGPGAVIMKMMRKEGYDKYYAGALSAASSVIGPIIPPSILMVIYALTDGKTTVTGLFLAGVLPGVLLGLVLMAANHIICVKKGYSNPSKRVSMKQLLKSFLNALPALVVPIIILGGIRIGIFTVTEAAAVAVAYALFVGLFVTKALTIKNIPGIVVKSAIITSSVLLVIAMGSAFSWALTYAQVPQHVASWMIGLTDNRLIVLFLIALFALITGMFVDTIPAMIILAPILSPVAAQYGADPLQVAMIIVLSLAVGMLTPPSAPLLFVISSVGRLNFSRLSIAVLPLILAELVVILLIILIPEVSTAIPNLFGYLQ
ncbi:TRAP transporter large permease [Peribacillus acanthi]|uniref:TRAP transporter large permease n=1 Tax=Peribacillus acanthi TaxID=2171554 RepID=UPI000D3EB034|nr:TRAP transporter large permease [Peribacillus acanthi]